MNFQNTVEVNNLRHRLAFRHLYTDDDFAQGNAFAEEEEEEEEEIDCRDRAIDMQRSL